MANIILIQSRLIFSVLDLKPSTDSDIGHDKGI